VTESSFPISIYNSRSALVPMLELLDQLGCKSNGRTHFLLGKTLLVARTASMAPSSGVAGTQVWWQRGAVAVAGSPETQRSTTVWRRGGGLPVASVPRVDRVATRVFGGVTEQRRTSCIEPPTPPLSFIRHCTTGAHQPCWAGRPRSGRESGVRAGCWA